MSKAEHLVQRAMQLFYRQGFHATGVDQLSREGELTKKTLYRYFPTKEALVHAALRARHELLLARIRAHVERRPTQQRPLAYIDFVCGWSREPDFCGCAFINAAAEYADAADPAHVIAAEHKKSLRDYLQRLCEEAGLAAPARAAATLFLIGEGLTVAAQVAGADAALADQAMALAAAALAQPA
ncbi:TetR/AcrR family transcriptional regulator [Paucibacter sp. XJ19-41]|uniref:TetR/AcrR family transcriptional regulator n=1 Tax=Paucibacter sp. XJ19-41 TaxID=2927824 RepID=UPI002349CEFC|nr:helix-turn-helix domain containing protein [Paucibacter sp. XJ19-41]MDC6167015.1 helix-turn-helix domain containing protein [Paucibacter sp. XJ19-41]